MLAERLADEQFYAASTVKLAVLVAVARALEAGTVTLETSLTSADTFQSEAPGAPDFRIDPDDLDEGMPAPGTPMPLADVVERMVVVSSNEATNMVVELVGRDAVNAALADAGATSSTFGRKYSDLAAAAALGGSHRTTAGDLATLMSAVVTGALAGPEWTSWMTAMLGRQHDRQLTAHVPDGVPFGSKSGGSTGSATTSRSSASRARTRWWWRCARVATSGLTPRRRSGRSACWPSPSPSANGELTRRKSAPKALQHRFAGQ